MTSLPVGGANRNAGKQEACDREWPAIQSYHIQGTCTIIRVYVSIKRSIIGSGIQLQEQTLSCKMMCESRQSGWSDKEADE